MTHPSPFECAIRALKQEQRSLPRKILAIDMDSCAAALCVCGADGAHAVQNGVKLDAQVRSPVSLYEDALSRLPGGTSIDEAALARAWRRYIQSDRQDAAFGGMSCAELESAFAPAAQLYGELFSQADALLKDDDETGILLFGRMAGRSLAVYAARDHFSADPFLPDPLFIDCPHPESLEEQGRALFQADAQSADRPFGHSVQLQLLNRGDGAPMQVPLAQPDQSRAELKNPHYGKPFYCAPGDSAAVIVDGEPLRLPVPDALFENSAAPAMVCAGFSVDEQGSALCLRRATGGASAVRIPLNVG